MLWIFLLRFDLPSFYLLEMILSDLKEMDGIPRNE